MLRRCHVKHLEEEKHLDFPPLPVPASRQTSPKTGGHENHRDVVPVIPYDKEQSRGRARMAESKQPKTNTTMKSLTGCT